MRKMRPRVFPNDVAATDGQTVITVVSMTDGGETPAIDCIAMGQTCLGKKAAVVPGLHRNGPTIGRKSLSPRTTAGDLNRPTPRKTRNERKKKTHRGFGSPGGSRSMTAPEGTAAVLRWAGFPTTQISFFGITPQSQSSASHDRLHNSLAQHPPPSKNSRFKTTFSVGLPLDSEKSRRQYPLERR